MASRESVQAVQGAGALLTLGAVFTWFGLATPFWSSFAWLGVFLLAGGVLVVGAMARSYVITSTDGVDWSVFDGAPEVATLTFRPSIPKVLRCAYCGTKVIDPEAAKCASCGAPVL